MLNKIFGSWKSSTAGILTAVLPLLAALIAIHTNPSAAAANPDIAFLVPIALLLPAKAWIIIGAISASGRILLGFFTVDADKTLAKVPGVADPQMVPAHPVPDDPAAKAVSTLVLFFALGILTLGLAGCVHAGQPKPLPVGAFNQLDASSDQVLHTIQAFMGPVVTDIRSGKLVPSDTTRATLNKLDDYYNKAAIAEQKYHGCLAAVPLGESVAVGSSASATCLVSAGLTAAMSNVQSAFSQVQTSLAGSITK